VAIESVLVDDAVRRDSRVISALMESIVKLRAKPYGAGLRDTGLVVTLLGHCAGPDAASALQQLAADPDSTIRSTAIQSLGRSPSRCASSSRPRRPVARRRSLSAPPSRGCWPRSQRRRCANFRRRRCNSSRPRRSRASARESSSPRWRSGRNDARQARRRGRFFVPCPPSFWLRYSLFSCVA